MTRPFCIFGDRRLNERSQGRHFLINVDSGIAGSVGTICVVVRAAHLDDTSTAVVEVKTFKWTVAGGASSHRCACRYIGIGPGILGE